MATDRRISAWVYLREALRHLRWDDGLTRDEMVNQSAALRRRPMDQLPPDFRFPNADSVISYFERLEAEGQIDVAIFPPPPGYADESTTGLTVPVHDVPPSVGSGAGSGSTGSSAQTGVGRWGTAEREHSTD